MKFKGHFITGLVPFILLVCLLATPQLQAQKASAEFIASIKPSSLTTGQKVTDGIQNVTYNDNILYVINVWSGIQVIDVSDIYNPKEISKFQNEHRAHNLFIEGTYGYLSDELEGVSILDVSNPKAITRLGKINTEGNAFWVEAKYPYVYVAEEEKGVRVYDITDFSNPEALGSFDTPGWAWGLRVMGDYVYVADKTGGLQVIDFTDKNNPVRLSQFVEPRQAKSIHIEENILYLTNGPDGLYILDISNPKFPTLISKVVPDGFIFDVYKSGKYAYMANESARKVEIINLTDPKNPQIDASYNSEDKVYGVWKEDVYVFVAANRQTLILRHNSPPILAKIEPPSIDEQALLTITPQGYDPDGDAVYYAIEKLPEGAQFDSSSGVVTWTPTYEQSGIYKDVTLRIIEKTDSKLSAEQSFSITVNHVNRVPSLPEVENYTVNENEVLRFELLEGSDPDVEDKGLLTYLAENMPEGATLDAAARIFSWKPTFEQSGTYVIDFLIQDPPGAVDRDASTITVVHVDRRPVIEVVENKTVNENILLTFDVSGSDPDTEDQNAISYAAYNLPEGASFDKASKQLSWTPTYDQAGKYQNILFVMTAGALSDSTTMSIDVNHVSRPPVLDNIALKMVDEQVLLSFMISGSDKDDEDQGNLKFSAGNLPPGAAFNTDSLLFTWTPTYEQSGSYADVTFTVTDVSGLTDSKSTSITVNHVNRPPVLQEVAAQTVDENTPLTITLSGSDPDQEDQDEIVFNIASVPDGANFDGTALTWTPGYDQSGEYLLDLSISDGRLTDKKSTTLTVTHVNRPPTLEPVTPQAVDENKPLQFNLIAADPDAEDAAKWTLTAGPLPEGAVFDAATASFNWTPTFDQSGQYTATFTNTDPAGLTISQETQITVNHVNRTPVFAPLTAQTGDENTVISFTVPPAEDPDVEDAQKLTYTAGDLPDGAVFDGTTRVLTWTPGYDQSGTYTATVSCSDTEFKVDQGLSITVNHVNRAPQLTPPGDKTVNENEALSVQVEASDPDSEDDGKTTLSASNLPQGASFDAASGIISWSPTYDQSGTYNAISVEVSDPAGEKASQTFNIVVNNVNRPPVITAAAPVTVAENTPLSQTFSGSDPDKEDEGQLKFAIANMPSGATLDAASGQFSWTPNFTQAGNYNLNLSITDAAGLSAETDVQVEVTNVNRLPVLQPVTDPSVDENGALSVSLVGSDEDTDDELTYSAEGLPGDAQIGSSGGSITWTPGYDQAGSYPVTAKVTDGESEASVTFTIIVNNINRAPEIQSAGPATVLPGETATLPFSANDPDGDALNFSSSDLPAGASLDAASGTFTWTPGEDQTGNFNFTVTVSDGTDSANASGSVTVNPPPAPPQPQEQKQ